MTKQLLRRRLRAARLDLPPATRAAEEAAVAAWILANAPAGARVVLGFAPMRGELDLRPVLDALTERCTVALPRIRGEALEPVAFTGWGELVPGPFGVDEPTGPPLPRVDMVLVPGLGFTRDGARIGYGGGFYDRFLAGHPAAWRVAVGFSVQVLDALPQEPWDQPVDVVVTGAGAWTTDARSHAATARRDQE